MNLRSGLKNLGIPDGKTESDWVAALGQPHAIKTLTSGRRLFEWHSGRVRTQMVSVLFDRNRDFLKVAAHYPDPLFSSNGTVTATSTISGFDEGRRAGIDLRGGPTTSVANGRRGLWSRSSR
jgi:hypothetical protein